MPRATPPDEPAPDIDDWFARRTYTADSFDADALRSRKEELGATISVVLPAVDEEATIAGVISSVMTLAGDLVDEVVVLDGGSQDATATIAAALGARVHTDDGVFPELGRALGKGDALWRSLAVTSGDIVVFIDTDIHNPTPQFVTGLLGPLLTDPDVKLVKAFYDRPVRLDDVLHDTGGGRVTELLARPLLNLFWPELAGLVQPLSGEYAGRRSLLESIPFLTGYGVEMGMLIDTLLAEGIDAIAQVDITRRIHRNQSLEALSRMAFGVAQAALRRIPADQAARFATLPHTYRQFARNDQGTMAMHQADVELVERPPMISLR